MSATGPWFAFGASVKGASHLRDSAPNQDALAQLDWQANTPLLVAVSDGHGDAKSFRSQAGANLAVRVAINVLRRHVAEQPQWRIGAGRDELARQIVEQWRSAVEETLRASPLTDVELTHLESRVGRSGRQAVEQDPWIAYGATLLALAASERSMMCLQIGDGDILTVCDKGRVERPFLPDPRFVANQTTSLCGRNAWREIRHHFVDEVVQLPALVLLCTDGYSNSFREEEGFRQAGADMLDLLRAHGPATIRDALPGWLEETSKRGSGDDVTVAVACREGALHVRQISLDDRDLICTEIGEAPASGEQGHGSARIARDGPTDVQSNSSPKEAHREP